MDLCAKTFLILPLVLAWWLYIKSSDPKAMPMAEDARKNLAKLDSCLQSSDYGGGLFSRCSQTLDDEEKRPRFAWDLADCYQRNSGRSPLPICDDWSSSMVSCRKKLDRYEHLVYLHFYMEANNICSHLQIHAFTQENEKTDRMIHHDAFTQENEKTDRMIHDAQERLKIMEEKLDYLWQNLNQIHKYIIRITFLKPSIVQEYPFVIREVS